jgi:hypothetical protein
MAGAAGAEVVLAARGSGFGEGVLAGVLQAMERGGERGSHGEDEHDEEGDGTQAAARRGGAGCEEPGMEC